MLIYVKHGTGEGGWERGRDGDRHMGLCLWTRLGDRVSRRLTYRVASGGGLWGRMVGDISKRSARRMESFPSITNKKSLERFVHLRRVRDVHEAYQAETETEASRLETEARPRRSSTGPRRDRDRGVQVQGETEANTAKT